MDHTDISGPEPPRSVPGAPPSAQAAVRPGAAQPEPAQCRRCGTRGRHADSGECINALRSLIADLEFRQEKRTHNSQGDGLASRRGGRRDRRDTRWVILDGDRVTLTDAARRLGLSTSALHWRIVRRTSDPAYHDVDLRAIGVDVPGRCANRRSPAECRV